VTNGFARPLLGHPRLVRDPVDFPGFTAIIRKGLLKVRGAGVHVRPDKSNQNGFAVDRILGEKRAASVFEFANLGWVHDADLAVSPIEPPLGFR